MRFKGKSVNTTGGGTGIGAAIVRRMLAEAANVKLVGRRLGPLQEIAHDNSFLAIAADAVDTKAFRGVVEQVTARFGGIDVLVANAGGHGVGPTLTMTDETWAAAARNNLDTAFVSARDCLPQLITRKGNIVVISSIAGFVCFGKNVGNLTGDGGNRCC